MYKTSVTSKLLTHESLFFIPPIKMESCEQLQLKREKLNLFFDIRI